MKNVYFVLLTALLLIGGQMNSSGQICDPTVPLFIVDLTGNPNGTWTSPNVSRTGLCCSASGADGCVEFVITLDSAANGISFDIISGAVPGGALYYQIDCGPPSSLGAPICLTGAGPHYLTFCKPGNNNNEYQIVSIPQPSAGGSQYVSQACTGFLVAEGLDESTISWTSVPSNPVYDSYLSCMAGCDTVVVTPSGAAPAFVDYQVCGNVSGACGVVSFCDTVRINFVNTLAVNINPQNPTICFGGANATVTAQPSGGLAPFNYLWSNGATTQAITVGAGTYIVQLIDAMSCSMVYDTVVVNALPSAIAANAGADQLLCNGAVQSVVLNGSITAATGGIWMNGTGTFNPDNVTLNSVYTPSASEISSGIVNLMLVTTGNAGCPPDSDYVQVTIAPQPSPSVTGIFNICQFSNELYVASNANPVNYLWTVTGGTITNNLGDSITVQWTSLGSGDVTVTASNSAGCDSTIQIPINVTPQPAPVLMGATSACTPATAVYHVTNAMNDNVGWTVTGGIIQGSASADSVIVLWNTSGTGIVSVTETAPLGCDSSLSMTVNLSATPITAISGLQNMCGPLQATYTTSPSNAVSFNWIVSGGNIISNNGSSIDVQWTAIGSNSITMTATNANGCDTTIIYAVNIYPQPAPGITGAALVCTPASSVYYVTSLSGNGYSWTVTGGTIAGSSIADSVVVNWSSAGTGTVILTELNSNGCDSTVLMSVALSATPVTSISGLQSMCGALQANYSTSPSNAISYNWVVNGGSIVSNNGNNIDVLWTAFGANSITMTATNSSGCDTTITYNVSVYPQPTPAITGATLVCTPATSVYHIANPTVNSYSWSVNGGTIAGSSNVDSVTVVWTSAGTGIVSVNEINSYGCDSIVAVTVNLSSTPVTAISGQQNICGHSTATYSAAPSNATTFNWTVNGGTILQNNGNNISVLWTSAGAATVTLTAVNPQGCDTTITYPVNLNPIPAPVLSGPVTLCLPSSSVYRVSSPGANNYTWSVTEGTILGSLSSDSISVQWNNITGTGTVTVIAANSFGCDSTTTLAVALSVTPSPFITGQQTFCGPQAALYAASSSNATTYNWTVNGGSVLNNNGDNILVQWNSTGTGSITMTAINDEGCDTTLYYNAIIYPQPSPSVAGLTSVCTPSNASYALSPASNNNYVWTVNGGTITGSSGGDSLQVQWNASGTGSVTLTETNSYGCDTTITTYVTLNAYPAPDITGNDLLCQQDTANYSVPPVPGHSYNWSVTGGAIVSFTVSNSIDVYWYNPGAGNVRVTQTSTQGCAALDIQPVYVNPPPNPVVTGPLVTCLNEQAQYLSTQHPGSTYSWTVSGGSVTGTASQPNALIQWESVGLGTLTVTETDSNGCSADAPLNVFINSLPTASISGSQVGCVDPYGSAYTATSLGNVYYQWSASDGNITSGNGQNHVNVLWNSTGISMVNLLTLNTSTGCRNTTSLQVLVDSMPHPEVTSNNFSGCAPLNTTFGSNPSATSYSYQWAFGDGATSEEITPAHSYATPGSYTITLVATNNSGCWDTVQAMVMVFSSPLAGFNLDVADGFYPVDETSFTLQNISAGGATYLWSFGDGNTSTDFEPAYQYSEPGTYQIMLMVTNAWGCRDSMLTSIEIKVPEEIFVPNAFTPNGDSRNDGFSVATHNITEMRVSIFDRWGEEVYSSSDKDFVWDGTYFGHRVEEGVYVYKIAAKGFHGKQFNRIGTVSIMK